MADDDIVARQRAAVQSIADKIEKAEPLTKMEIQFAVAVLRGAVEGIKRRKNSPGRPPKIPADVLIQYKFLRSFGMSPAEAHKDLMKRYGITDLRTLTKRLERLEEKHGHKFKIGRDKT